MDDSPVQIDCPHCGHVIIETDPSFDEARGEHRCSHCGRTFSLEGDWGIQFQADEVFWYLAPVLRCECRAMIELPYSNLPQTDEHGKRLLEGGDPPELPSEEWSATFGCPECGRIREFSYRDVEVVPIPKLKEGVYQSGKGVYSAKFPCGDRHCTVLASMYLDIGNGSATEAVRRLRSGIFDGTQLPCGHEIKTVPEKFYKIEPVMRRLW